MPRQRRWRRYARKLAAGDAARDAKDKRRRRAEAAKPRGENGLALRDLHLRVRQDVRPEA